MKELLFAIALVFATNTSHAQLQLVSEEVIADTVLGIFTSEYLSYLEETPDTVIVSVAVQSIPDVPDSTTILVQATRAQIESASFGDTAVVQIRYRVVYHIQTPTHKVLVATGNPIYVLAGVRTRRK